MDVPHRCRSIPVSLKKWTFPRGLPLPSRKKLPFCGCAVRTVQSHLGFRSFLGHVVFAEKCEQKWLPQPRGYRLPGFLSLQMCFRLVTWILTYMGKAFSRLTVCKKRPRSRFGGTTKSVQKRFRCSCAVRFRRQVNFQKCLLGTLRARKSE